MDLCDETALKEPEPRSRSQSWKFGSMGAIETELELEPKSWKFSSQPAPKWALELKAEWLSFAWTGLSQSFKSISHLRKKLCPFFKVPKTALFCVVFGFFHLQGRGDPPDPKYYNKFWVFRGQVCHKMFNLGFQNFLGYGLWLWVI